MNPIEEPTLTGKKNAAIISVRKLTESSYILRFERNHLIFQPGQYLVIGPKDKKQKREYSIYSANTSPYLEVLIKAVDDGFISRELKNSKPGDILEIEGPFGYFVLDEKRIPDRQFLFIASGTGISPFHSIIKSNPHIKYTLLHGVRKINEGYERDQYEPGQYIQCTSREKGSEYYGRVTDYLKKNPIDPNSHCYLCGNSAMIDEAFSILEKQGIPAHHLHAEVYF